MSIKKNTIDILPLTSNKRQYRNRPGIKQPVLRCLSGENHDKLLVSLAHGIFYNNPCRRRLFLEVFCLAGKTICGNHDESVRIAEISVIIVRNYLFRKYGKFHQFYQETMSSREL